MWLELTLCQYQELLALFVFPDSRAEWMQLLQKSMKHIGLTQAGLGVSDYVSYDSDIAALPEDAPTLSSASSSSASSH